MKWFPQYLQPMGWPYSDSLGWQQRRGMPAFTHSGRHWLLEISTHVTRPSMPVPSLDWVYADVASDCSPSQPDSQAAWQRSHRALEH